MFESIVLGFLGFFDSNVSKISSLNRAFQDLFNGILYFYVAQLIVDVANFVFLGIVGSLVDLKNGKIWSLLS